MLELKGTIFNFSSYYQQNVKKDSVVVMLGIVWHIYLLKLEC